MVEQNLDALFGAPWPGDYQKGEQITFIQNGKQLTGSVIHCSAPQKTVSGKQLPTTYEVDCNDGIPHIVPSNKVVGN